MRKRERRSGKYKGKLPFKILNYGRIGHLTYECAYKDNSNEEKGEK